MNNSLPIWHGNREGRTVAVILQKESMIVLVMTLLPVFAACATQDELTITTKYGQVQGHLVKVTEGQSVRSFLGVPYAKPPVGSLRFKATEEPDPWSEPFSASSPGNVCPHDAEYFRGQFPSWNKYNEDCLNMNIFAPHNLSEPGPHPVYVFFHGGSYYLGGNIDFAGHFYAIRGVIMVVPNYRLGILGFLSTGDRVAPGNYGMLDQVQALRFVRDNIRAFGGDPSRVTIGGNSAGSTACGLHMVSPMSRGLFYGAIMVSGSELQTWAMNSPEVTVNLTRQVARQVGCTSASGEEMVNCLRGISAHRLANATWVDYPGFRTLGPSPTLDAATSGFLPDFPRNYREKMDFARVPILAGFTSKETSWSFTGYQDGMSKEEFEKMTQIRVNYYYQYKPEILRRIWRAAIQQYTPWDRPGDRAAYRDKQIELYDDLDFVTSIDQTQKYHARSGQAVYAYLFNYRSRLEDLQTPNWMGVYHAYDKRFNRGQMLLASHPDVAADLTWPAATFYSATEEDVQFCNYWIDMMANFVKMGNPTPTPHPSPGNKPATAWERFTPVGLHYLYLGNDTIEVRTGLRQSNHGFWNSYVPWIVNNTNTEAPSLGTRHSLSIVNMFIVIYLMVESRTLI